MKKNLFSVLIFLALLAAICTVPVYAADHFNAGTVTVYEDGDQVSIKFVVVLASGADTTGSWHSKPIYIADLNAVDGYAYCVQDAAGDVNVLYHYSMDDKTTWASIITPLTLDQVSNTTKIDTLGYGSSDDREFPFARYLVVELDGQTANASNTITWFASFQKDGTLTVDAYQKMPSRVSTGAVNNP